MHLSRICRPRALLVTICAFSLSFLIVLNLMVNQLQNSENGLKSRSVSNVLHQRDNYDIADLEFENYVAKGNRKPKAANDRILNDGSNIVITSRKNKHGSTRKELNFKFQRDKERLLDEIKDVQYNRHEDKNDYMDDINNVVIEDEDEDEDDDDDDDEGQTENEKNIQGVSNNEKYFKVKLQKGSIFEQKHLKHASKFTFKKPPLRYQEVKKKDVIKSNILTYQNKIGEKYMNSKDVVDGIFWSDEVEGLIPKGLSLKEAEEYTSSAQNQSVKYLKPPTWNRCGRPKNGFVVLQDGKSMCARYRDPHNKFVLGELLSFYLSRLLGMDNIPAVILSWTNSPWTKWRNVRIESLEWKNGKFLALIQWIPNMETMKSHVRIPQMIYKSYKYGQPITVKTIQNSSLTQHEVSELLQWGSMIIFDYLTGNYDRVASMQDAADKENKPSIVLENIRNLRRSTKTSKLWLIDNESGLLDAYDLLYKGGASGARFIKFHKEMLQTMCIFQRSMVDSLFQLNKSISPHILLEKFARGRDKILNSVPKDNTYKLFQKYFPQRLNEVQEWIKHCELLSSR